MRKLIANETAAMFWCNEKAYKDRKIFVENLGDLLSQTREGVLGCELKENEIVEVTFTDGYVKKVNIDCDSYLAIIKDVIKQAF